VSRSILFLLVANFVAHCLWRHARHDGLLYARSTLQVEASLLGLVSVRLHLRRVQGHAYSFSAETSGSILHTHLWVCSVHDCRPDKYSCFSRSSEMSSPVTFALLLSRSHATFVARTVWQPSLFMCKGTLEGNDGGGRGWPGMHC